MTGSTASLPRAEAIHTASVSGSLDLARIQATSPLRLPFLLQSVASGTVNSRYSLLLAATGETLELRTGALRGAVAAPECGFLTNLDAWFARAQIAEDDSEWPFVGGWFLYLGYELAAEIEPKLTLPPDPLGLPVALAARCDGAIVVDHGDETGWCVAESAERLDELVEFCTGAARPALGPWRCGDVAEEAPARFGAALRAVHEYILAGDVFQANLSRAWSLAGEFGPAEAYRRLCNANPAPFAACVHIGDRSVVSSSPERLVRVRGQSVSTRPIAGTRRRGQGGADQALRDELLAHPKERAEHIMLLDLERNDLGRVCRPGSVCVSELMVTESYTHVHHIVSNVEGVLRDAVTPGHVIKAVFPGGTITGCPKVRCMEIIAELEGVGRGAYTGSLGYLDRRGRMDLNILIRTAVRTPEGLHFRAGAGLVADSEFERELDETRAKAAGLLRAFEP